VSCNTFSVESLQAIAGGIRILVHICAVYAYSSLSQYVQFCRARQCAGLVSSSHWFRTCCPVTELRLPFWSLFVLLGTMPADNVSIACRQRTVLRFFFMSACMIVCVIFTKVCLSDSIAQQWQTCLDCSFQFHCFKILLLLVSVSLIPDQCNGAELSILLCIAWGCQT